jgi:putative membrane protein
MQRKVFVVCVDRDNDIGRKTGENGPIIGLERNLSVAQKLILKDPTESDANTMFAAINKLEEAKKEFKNVEIVTLTGKDKLGLKSDKELNKQLDKLQKKYLVDGWILVTDGMEDSQVIPLLQSRAKIISTEQVIIKQAQAVESTFYTIKEALKDPGISRLFFGIPGILLLVFFVLGQYSFQAIALILGVYLILKGFGIEEKIVGMFNMITSSIFEQRISVVMYVAAILSPFFGLWLVYLQLMTSEFIDIGIDLISALRLFYPFMALMAIALIVGRAIDSIYAKKAYKLGRYLLQGTSIIAIWAILDAGTLVFLRQVELAWFPANIMAAFIALLITMKIASTFDIREKITNSLIGLNVLDDNGNYIGKVIEINKKKQSIIYQGEKNTIIEKKKKQFYLKNGRINLLA